MLSRRSSLNSIRLQHLETFSLIQKAIAIDEMYMITLLIIVSRVRNEMNMQTFRDSAYCDRVIVHLQKLDSKCCADVCS